MKEKPDFSLALIDGDIVAYRCSISSQDDSDIVCAIRIDDLMEHCLNETIGFAVKGNCKTYLTGKNNFRYEIAKSFHYKGNRDDSTKPEHLEFARKHLTEKWGAITVEGAEADDAIATEAMLHEDVVIVSQDKDFNTVPCWKYNFVNGVWRYDDEWSALKYFYTQVLTGDAVDNIKGLWRVGPVKAGKLLAECETERELYEACLNAYMNSAHEHRGNPDYPIWKRAEDRVLENARLLHLRRFKDEMWSPPE